MIGKAKACPGGIALFRYILDEKKGFLLDSNLIAGTMPGEIHKDFLLMASNSSATNTVFSMVLSPAIDDGKAASDAEMRSICGDFMKKLGMEKQQYVVFIHNNTAAKHAHLLVNRVLADSGKLLSDHYIGRKAHRAAHEIALERGMVSARSLMIDSLQKKIPVLDSDWKIKRQIWESFKSVMNRGGKITIQEFHEGMERLGIRVSLTRNNKGPIQGYRVMHLKSRTEYKASAVNREMSLQKMIKKGLTFDSQERMNPPLQKLWNGMLSRYIVYAVRKNLKQTLEQEKDE